MRPLMLSEIARMTSGRLHGVDIAIGLGFAVQVGMGARSAQPFIIGGHDGIACRQPVIEVSDIALGAPLKRRGADIGDTHCPLGPGKHRPAPLGGLALWREYGAGIR